jgi:uncharacterized protein (DUF697 family)
MLTKTFWLGESGVLVRAVRTFAQTLISVIGVSAASIFTVDWKTALGTAALASLLSVLMSLDRNSETKEHKVVFVQEQGAPQRLQAGYDGDLR